MIPITVVGLVCLALFAMVGSYWTVDKKHQATVVPTLLSIIDPDTHNHIFALSNPLYDRLREASLSDMEDSPWESDGELPELWLDKNQIVPGESLTLTWTVGRSADTGNIILDDDSDVIALYCQEAQSFLEAATISQVRTTSEFHGGNQDSWYIPSFPNLRQEYCHFRLYASISARETDEGDSAETPMSQQYVHIASSEQLEIKHAKETPLSIHLALTNKTSKMIVQFTTGDVMDAVPVARISPVQQSQSGESATWDRTVEGSTDTYSAKDLCQTPGNLTQAGKFYPPGMLHMVELDDLLLETQYKYQIGLLQNGTVLVWSDEYTFHTAPEEGNPDSFSYIVYGDQGSPYLGWQGGRDWLVAMMKRENPASVHHFGDISYARGAAHVWDNWFDMVQPIATKVPLMIAIGNHEYDHTDGGGPGKDPSGVSTAHGFMPSWGNFGEDSGGECGIPMAKRFQMPSAPQSNGVFWYSFNYGLVHTVVVSSEHDLSLGSPQYQFLENDLASVNRNTTPWIVLELHRPLYEGEGSGSWWHQHLVGEAMRKEFEDLLLAYKVDLVLAGHYHEYQRTCDGLYQGECGKGGPMHITIGSAGAILDAGFDLLNVWTDYFIKGRFGYGKVTVVNRTAMHIEFVAHGAMDDERGGMVMDDVWIQRPQR